VARKTTVATKVDADLADWLDAYAKERGASKSSLVEAAIRSLRDDAARGVPDVAPKARPVRREPMASSVAAVRARLQREGAGQKLMSAEEVRELKQKQTKAWRGR
jgi:Ribbon-helix-helix protein, copG family